MAVNFFIVPLELQAECRAWWFYQWLDQNRFKRFRREVCWVFFCSQIYQQNVWVGEEQTVYLFRWLHLFTSQQTDLLLLPLLTGIWQGFRSGAITDAWYWILILLVIHDTVSIDPGLWTLLMVTWSCLWFPFALVPTSSSLACSLTACSPSKTICLVLFLLSHRELAF